MSTFEVLRRDLLLYYIDNGRSVPSLYSFLQNHSVLEEEKDFVVCDIQQKLLSQFNKRWNQASRTKSKFLKNNEEWLNQKYSVTLPAISGEDADDFSTPSTSTGKRGRPCVLYEDSSESGKKRKNTALLREYGFEHIYAAYIQALRSNGQGKEANLVETIRSADPEKKELITKLLRSEPVNTLSDDEALSVFIDLDLNKSQYMYLRTLTNERNCCIFPPYYKIQKSKEQCYPPKEALQITNTFAKVISLQDLLDHTGSRILMIESVYKTGLRDLLLYSKWGCDGSSGQSEYKQKLPEESNVISDANLFIVSMVPIRLIDRATGNIIWQNPAPSSIRFCRPIQIEYSKETPEKTKTVVNQVKDQIKLLNPSLINKNGEGVEIKHELFLTMIDGKVAQVLTETSSSAKCTICGAKPSEMNNLEKVRAMPENEQAFEYGLSTLHAWIRCLEMILHISYNLDFKKWMATGDENKELKKLKMGYVQERFRKELGLIIDKPKQVSGNTNDGNTARRFFYNSCVASDITGVDEELIHRLHIILQVLSSGIMVDAKAFGDYALETARFYVSKYNWYYMPSSVHKILIHGENIIKHFAVLPIGQLSEDAQESRNKDYKKFRLHHARKCSRSATNEDVLHTLLYTSDPYISSIRKTYKRNIQRLDEEALALLSSQVIPDPEVINI